MNGSAAEEFTHPRRNVPDDIRADKMRMSTELEILLKQALIIVTKMTAKMGTSTRVQLEASIITMLLSKLGRVTILGI